MSIADNIKELKVLWKEYDPPKNFEGNTLNLKSIKLDFKSGARLLLSANKCSKEIIIHVRIIL